MEVRVIYFAILRQMIGQREEVWDIPEGSLVQDLLIQIASKYPKLQGLTSRLAVAINHEYSPLDRPLVAGDEVALLPPVAGGSGLEPELTERIQVKHEPLLVEDVCRLVQVESGGAIVSFTGLIRRQSQGRRVEHLDYEAYGPMAVKEMTKIAHEIEQRWAGSLVAIHHRVGSLQVGELAVVIAVCTPHRREAFEACSYAIEQLKQKVPIWKHEFFEDGSHWVGWGP